MSKPYYVPTDRIPLPPSDADVFTTACDYCIVACGYKVYRWPIGKEGGPRAHENALGVDFPRGPMQGGWISPNMHNVVTHNGKLHNVIVVPDKDTKVVNVGGDHSVRGGTIAKKCYNPNTPTRDRLKYPMVRVNGKLERMSWDDTFDIMTAVSKHVIKKHGRDAWGMKMFSYQYWENTHALTKLALRHVRTRAFAVHDQPTGTGSDTPGMTDAGLDPFGASYEDWSLAETIFISGSDPFEAKTIVFNDWMMKAVGKGGKLIFVVPRSTAGVAFAEETGGLFLPIIPGTDTVLHVALARIIIENGWQDTEFIDRFINNDFENNNEVFQANGFEDYKEWILSVEYSKLDKASEITGIPKEKILKAAELMAKPKADGSRRKLSVAYEKGCYWSNNYLNTASLASLGLICGSGNRPGQMISRLGGHQRGMMPGGEYPVHKAMEKFPNHKKKGIDLDRYVGDGKCRWVWVVGTTWIQAMLASGALRKSIEKLTLHNPHQVTRTNKQHIIDTLKKRADSGGMVLVHQDIYPVEPINTQIADIVLPVAGWGEENFTRANGERRIRLYQKFNDAPGEAKPDWWIAAQFGKRMGYRGFDWKTSNEIFEDAAWYGKGRRTSYWPLVWYAKKRGKTGHELLGEYGTTGIQAPVRYEDGKLIGTKRLHDTNLKLGTTYNLTGNNHKWLTDFKTSSGRANLLKSPWEVFSDFYEHMKPRSEDEFWVTSGRINEIWQSGFDDQIRRPYLRQRWPDNFIEINSADAQRLGLENGDKVAVSSDRVPVQVGGYDQEDPAALGVVLEEKTVKDAEDPDLLVQSLDEDRYRGQSRQGSRMMTADVESDLLTDPSFGFDEDVASSGSSDPRKDAEQADPNVETDHLMEEVQNGIGLTWDEVKGLMFSELNRKGHIEYHSAEFEAVVMVTDAVRAGVLFTYFLVPSSAANALAPRVLDPISQRPRYKISVGKVRKIGESPYKNDFSMMSFVPRNLRFSS